MKFQNGEVLQNKQDNFILKNAAAASEYAKLKLQKIQKHKEKNFLSKLDRLKRIGNNDKLLKKNAFHFHKDFSPSRMTPSLSSSIIPSSDDDDSKETLCCSQEDLFDKKSKVKDIKANSYIKNDEKSDKEDGVKLKEDTSLKINSFSKASIMTFKENPHWKKAVGALSINYF